MKQWYMSRTLWVNLLMAILVVVQYAVGQQWLAVQWEGLIVILANLGMRFITEQPVTIPFLKSDN